MVLDDLVVGMENFRTFGGVPVYQIAFDSREIERRNDGSGALFFALPGSNTDGHNLIGDVLAKNSYSVVISERDLTKFCERSIQVSDIRTTMAIAARKFTDFPDKKLKVIAITGTDGKTTTAYLCRAMLSRMGKTAMFGTVECDIGGKIESCPNTTPAAITLFKMINRAVANGCKNLALEVSSHGIEERRAYGLDVDVAIFTNLSSEHLDFHKTIGSYFVTKMKLFNGANGCLPKFSAVNIDDTHGRGLFSLLKDSGRKVFSFGFSPGADFKICNVEKNDITGSAFEILADGSVYKFSSPMFGAHNLVNVAAAFTACAMIYGCRREFIEAVGEFASVPGRLERVNLANGVIAFVDYAHTPRALEVVLGVLSASKKGKLIAVFGCGGDRDADKRAPMTKVANEISDFAIATSDNPRNEPQENIFSDMARGVVDGKKIVFIADRKEAISRALLLAEAGDVVLVAGKGHEPYQIIDGKILDFDDRKILESVSLRLEKSRRRMGKDGDGM
ncbi:MAG: UDP-N-acetylmuramoyl-L-alanyl-D-glutamate--2,6-diaminopimelate ligase [Puniceicoccales bacterium]|nr:UDP-N-acetylmuramoyl-L-alanyl-D-glutamate--2,6-diaminopimelate ligase [Puniceicoccales bacterium]